MLTQEQITNFWNQVSNGEIVEGITKVVSDKDTLCIRTGLSETECYSRRNENSLWEEIKFVGESPEFL